MFQAVFTAITTFCATLRGLAPSLKHQNVRQVVLPIPASAQMLVPLLLNTFAPEKPFRLEFLLMEKRFGAIR
jgi:hypothetical protein